MKTHWGAAATLLFLLLTGSQGRAAQGDLSLSVAAPGPHSDLLGQHLYEVRISCSIGNNFPSGTGIGLIDNSQPTSSHYIAIVTVLPTQDSSTGGMKLPDKTTALLPLYSFKGPREEDNRPACKQPISIVVPGGSNIYLIPFESYSTEHTPGILLNIVWGAAKLIPALYSVFTSRNIPSNVSGTLTNIGATQDSIKTILTSLNKDENYGSSLPLRKGKYLISTKYSSTTIQVLDLPSVVNSTVESIKTDFRNQLNSATDQLKADDSGTSCRAAAVALTLAGMSQAYDVPYAIAYRAAKSGFSKTQIMDCLSRDFALHAAQLGPKLWQYVLPSQLLTEDDVLNYFPAPIEVAQQPPFSSIESKVYSMMVRMSRISKNGVENAKDSVSNLPSLFAPKVLLDDQSQAGIFPNSKDPIAPVDVIKSLIDAKFLRFGCYAEDTAATGKNVDGAVILFLAFRAGVDDPGTTIDKAIVVHVFYVRGLVSRFVVYDNQAWIYAVLDPKWNCNGFTVAKPKTPSSS